MPDGEDRIPYNSAESSECPRVEERRGIELGGSQGWLWGKG